MSKVKEKSPPSPWEQAFSSSEVYTPEEVAAKVKVRPRQVRRWMDEQGLKFTPLPRGRRILGQHVIDFLSGREEDRG